MVSKLIFTLMMIISGTTIIQQCSGSAIPMWEFLSRSEKMSHLYTTFAKQVSDYCKTSDDARLQSVAQCKRDLLTYGLERLQSFSDVRLDTMDPYQRGANDIIWEIIMKGHPIVKTSLQQNSQLSPSASSLSSLAIILGNTGSQNSYKQNPLFDNKDDGSSPSPSSSSSSSYAMDMDTEYGYFNRRQYQKPIEIIYNNNNNNNNNNNEPIRHTVQNSKTNSLRSEMININNNNKNKNYNDDFSSISPSVVLPFRDNEQPTTYLTGPMVVRVRPDGTPVEEDRNKPLPSDDDREIMQIGQIKMPNVQKLTQIFNNNNNNNNNHRYHNGQEQEKLFLKNNNNDQKGNYNSKDQ